MTEKKVVVGKGTKYPLKGKIVLPDNVKKPVPAVVFVHGSGSSNMDEKVSKLTPFKDLAEGLAEHGIASIRYDKRTKAHPFKCVKEDIFTVKEETVEDAVLAAELLKKEKAIDSDRIFIVGHSMGAMLAPRIDAEGGSFKGLIMMAGTLRKLEDILLYQIDEMMADMGWLKRKIAEKQLKGFKDMFDGMYELSDEEAKAKKVGNGATLYYFREMGEHPATRYLKTSNKPMLIMQGGCDTQAKADIDFKSYKELLGDRSNVTFKLYDGLNHAFVPAIYSDISKAKQEFSVERHIGSDVIADIANWILSIK